MSYVLTHPGLILLLAASLLAVLPGRMLAGRLNACIPLLAGLAGLAAVLVMYSHLTGRAIIPYSYLSLDYLSLKLRPFQVDRLSLLFVGVFAVQVLLGFIYSAHLRQKGHQIAALLYPAGAFICVLAGDYLTLFVGWELMSLASVFLIWLARTEASSQAGYRYLLLHILGGLVLLSGIALRYQATGDWLIGPIAEAGVPSLAEWLIFTGFCINAAVIPLHAWLTDAYPEATVVGAVFLSAFTTKTAVYVLARVYPGLEILVYAGIVMALWGVFYAVMENNARRILAYHIISQVGYMLAGIGMGTALTLNGAVSHAYAHIIYKGLLFMAAGALLQAAGTADLSRLGGLARRMPWLLVLYMAGAVSIAGLPLFSGFVTKNMTIAGAMAGGWPIIGLLLELAAVGTFLSIGLKLPWFAFMGQAHKMPGKISDKPLNKISWNMYLAMGLAALICLAIGLVPDLLYNLLPFEPDGGVSAYQAVAVAYTPYTAWQVMQSLLIFGFTGLGFVLIRRILTPKAGRLADFDLLYRLIGRLASDVLGKILAWLDNLWSRVWATVGLRGLMWKARLANLFDKRVIDVAVDNTAFGFRGLGRLLSLIQTGNLQTAIGAAVLITVGIILLVLRLAGN